MPPQNIGHLPGAQNTQGLEISGDGSTIVGRGNFEYFPPAGRAFYWRESTGIQALPGLENDYTNWAISTSYDGARIAAGLGVYENLSLLSGVPAGRISGDGRTIIYGSNVWREGIGVQSIETVFHEAGLSWGADPSSFFYPTGISDDGKTIVGFRQNGAHKRAWIAHIPEPATLALLLPFLFWRKKS